MSDFNGKMHQIQFWLVLCPRPWDGAYSALLHILVGFKGSTSKGGEGKKVGNGRVKREMGEERKRLGMGKWEREMGGGIRGEEREGDPKGWFNP